ncbi:MAG: hypothetical protein JWO36_6470, partial [Myxococcales bacterium]|nr:hypothetical protein [Myxococcales bacterium]
MTTTEPETDRAGGREVEGARILVVDDERVIREILAEFLALEGFSVHTVEDGEKAL